MLKWAVPKKALETVIDIIDNVPTRSGIKSSEFIKISKAGGDAASFFLTSDIGSKATLKAGDTFPFKDDIYLDRRLFMPFVAKGKDYLDAEYFILEKDNVIIVRHGNRRAVYAKVKDISGYEDIDKVKFTSILPVNKKWASLVDCADNCASPDPITPTLNAVYITPTKKELEIYSTNEQVIFFGRYPNKTKLKTSIAFPLLLVPVLNKEGAEKLIWNDKLAAVVFQKGKIWQAVKTEARKNFPLKAIKERLSEISQSKQIATIHGSTFVKAVDRLVSYVSPLLSDDLALSFEFKKDTSRLDIKSGIDESNFSEIVKLLNVSKNDLVLEWPLAMTVATILFCDDMGKIHLGLLKNGISCMRAKELTLVVSKLRSK